MPSTKGLEVFVRKDSLTDEQWFNLIKDRRELIKPLLDSFTLPELGALECMRSEFTFTHMLGSDAPTITGDERFSLKTQGIFRKQPWSAVEKIPNSGYCYRPSSLGGVNYPDGTMRVWGLTRSGLWVLVTISFEGKKHSYHDWGYEQAKTVEIVETNLPTIAAETKEKPQQMWEELGEAIKDFKKNHELLYNQALNLARIVEIEELAFLLIPKEV